MTDYIHDLALVKLRFFSRFIPAIFYFIVATLILLRYFRQRKELKKPMTVVIQLVFVIMSGLLDTIRNSMLLYNHVLHSISIAGFFAVEHPQDVSCVELGDLFERDPVVGVGGGDHQVDRIVVPNFVG